MNIYDIAAPIMESIVDDKVATMALFTAYINNRIAYKFFCDELPVELFDSWKYVMQNSEMLRNAYQDSVALDCGVETYLKKACKDYDMWIRLLEGTQTILNDSHLVQRLFNDDRCFVEDMYSHWKKGMLNEINWNAELENLGQNSYLSGIPE